MKLGNNGICENVLEAVGGTPLIKLNRLTEGLGRTVLVKLEGLNPGGSIKTRTALNMINDAEKRGVLKPDSVIIEFTSGNQGIGLALVAAARGYKCAIVMPEIMSEERKKIIRAYGAELILTPAAEDITATFELAKKEAERIVASDPKYFLAGQFDNQANCEAHYNGTAEEIIAQLGDTPLGGFVAAVGTGGTVTGTGHRLKEHYPSARIVTVEPDTAAILTGGKVGFHKQQGIGDGFIPNILDTNCYDEVLLVSDDQAYDTVRKMAKLEGLLVGVSSGTNVYAAIELAKKLPEGSVVVAVCADLGDRYLSTPDLFI